MVSSEGAKGVKTFFTRFWVVIPNSNIDNDIREDVWKIKIILLVPQVAVVDASCCAALVMQGAESVWDG
jgi:hypothetical protein